MEEDGGRRRDAWRRRDMWRRPAVEDTLDAADVAVLDGLARRYAVPKPVRLLEDRELLGQLVAQAARAVERLPDLAADDRHLWVARYFRLEERMYLWDTGDPHRRHHRRRVDRPCMVTPLRAPAGAGPQPPEPPTRERMAPEPPVMAAIMDVSTGGCAFTILGPFAEGKMARIDFDLDGRTPVTAIGCARAVRPQRPAGTIVHLQFIRLAHEHRNRIHRFVFHRRPTDGQPRR